MTGRGKDDGAPRSFVESDGGVADDQALLGVDRLFVVAESTASAVADRTEQRINRGEPRTHGACRGRSRRGRKKPSASRRVATSSDSRSVASSRATLAVVERAGIAKARAHVGEVGSGDHDRALVVNDGACGLVRSARSSLLFFGLVALRWCSPRPARIGMMRARRRAEQVLPEDCHRLERVLALVIELVGIRVEIARAGDERRCESWSAAAMPERRLECLPAQSEQRLHRCVRCPKQDERFHASVGRAFAGSPASAPANSGHRATGRCEVRPGDQAVVGAAVRAASPF